MLLKNRVRFLLLLILLLLPMWASAQDKDILSPLEEVADVVAQAEYGIDSKYDGNRCAIIKVYTSIEQDNLQFVTDLASSIELIHSPYLGQVWVHLSAGAMQLTVHHKKFHYTRTIPGGVKTGRVYETTLNYDEQVQKKEEEEEGDGGHYFILRTTPQEVEVVIDDSIRLSTSNGYINQFLSNGSHNYSVSSRLYASTGGVVYMKNERVEQEVNLRPQFGYISLTATPTASIYIDDIEVGQTPYTSPRLPLGNHMVRLSAAGYESYDTAINLSEPAETVRVSRNLVSLFSNITLEAMSGATILVNGERKGVGSWRGDLMPGEYLVTTTIDGHRESKQRIVVEKNTPLTVTLDQPTPIYGKLNVNATQPDVEVTLDGVKLGTAPNIFSNILVGTHSVIYSGKGLKSKSERITIEEGKTIQATVTQQEGVKITVPENMVFVEGGTFKMGGSNGRYQNEKPRHTVRVSSFYIGKYEVTQAEWESVMGSNPCGMEVVTQPVEYVSWYDCVEFCNALSRKEGREECYKIEGDKVTLREGKKGYRLPTEAEWEYAAKGGNKSKRYIYAGSNTIGSVAWYSINSKNLPHKVGGKQPNELGVYDMSGNVYEWCWDWYGSYASKAQTNPTGADTGSKRVCRGGNWYFDARYCWVSDRHRSTPSNSYGGYGVRLVLVQ